MARDSRDWSVPAPLRTLLWWPALSFVLVLLLPDAAVAAIAAAGVGLAVLGVLTATLCRWAARPAGEPARPDARVAAR